MTNKIKKFKVLAIIGILILNIFATIPVQVRAEDTYYISQSGNDSNSGRENSPWKTFQKAFSTMPGGSTLIVEDGIYKDTIKDPPSGSANSYTTIRARNDGGVTIDGSELTDWNYPMRISEKSYIQIEGIKFQGGSASGEYTGVSLIMWSDYIKVKRCAFVDLGTHSSDETGNISNFVLEQTHYVLVEDSWAYGGGRYKFEAHESDKIIFRRTVARHDRMDSRFPQSLYSIYRSSNVELQNAIGIDSNQNQYYTGDSGFYGAIFSPNSDTTYPNNGLKILGSIMLNIDSNSAGVPFTLGDHTITNSVFWNNRGGISYSWPTNANVNLNHVTLGDIYGEYVGDINPSAGVGVYGFGQGSNITNSLLYKNKVRAIHYFGYSDYNNFYENGENYGAGWENGQQQISTAQGTHDKFLNPEIKYITKIEDISSLHGAASDGGNIGATVLKKYGVSGTLWGDPGFENLTSEDLWPWPYESRIKNDFASYNPTTGPTGARGFAAQNQSLTKYIWEYLGNPCPTNICNGSTSPTQNPPAQASTPTPTPTPNPVPITPLPIATPAPNPSPVTPVPVITPTPAPSPSITPSTPVTNTDPNYPDGTIIRFRNSQDFYIILNGSRRLIDSALRRKKFPNAKIKIVNQSILNKFPLGNPISYDNGTFVREQGKSKIYIFENGFKRHILSLRFLKELLKTYRQQVIVVPAGSLDKFPTGTAIGN